MDIAKVALFGPLRKSSTTEAKGGNLAALPGAFDRARAVKLPPPAGWRFYSMSSPRAEYVLTAKGRELGPIVGAMRDWGRKYGR